MRKPHQVGVIAATAISLVLAASGCSGGGGDTSADGEPITLTYWAGAGAEEAAEVWNESHPDIQVETVTLTNGQEATTKLLTAIEAGSGAPDVMATEYSNIPTLLTNGALADLAPLGADELSDSYPDSAWESVTLGGDGIYGVPGDIGPMMFYYRTDVFDSLGLQVPTTWEEYATAAQTIHASDPNVYLGTFTGADASVFQALTQQAGASWWSVDGDAWTVDIDNAATQQVASYWGGLVESGVIDNQPLFTPEWNAAINSGQQVGWLAPVWGAGVLASNAPDTEGNWAAAALPVWDASDPASGNWGGQAQVVTSQSEHAEAAYEFAKWLSTSQEGLSALVDAIGIYPAALDKQGTVDAPPAFLSTQADFYDLADQSAQLVTPVTFGPDVNVAYNTYVDTFGAAVQARSASAFTAALATIQQTVVDDMESSGFTVN